MPGNGHVRFGGRPGETDRLQGRHRAPGRPNLERVNKEIKRRARVVGIFLRGSLRSAAGLSGSAATLARSRG